MSIQIKAPQFPESIAEGTVASWHKRPGEPCQRDEVLVDIETDKVVLEVVAPADGALVELLKNEGDTVLSEEPIARFEAGAGRAEAAPAEAAPAEESAGAAREVESLLSPAARQLVAEHGIAPAALTGTGKGGRITKEDVLQHIRQPKTAEAAGGCPGSCARGGALDARGGAGAACRGEPAGAARSDDASAHAGRRAPSRRHA